MSDRVKIALFFALVVGVMTALIATLVKLGQRELDVSESCAVVSKNPRLIRCIDEHALCYAYGDRVSCFKKEK